MALVHPPHNYTKLYFLESLGYLQHGINRQHWKFRDEGGVQRENVFYAMNNFRFDHLSLFVIDAWKYTLSVIYHIHSCYIYS